MPAKAPTAKKDHRISVNLDDANLDEAVALLAKQLRTSKGGLGALAMSFVIPGLRSGKLSVVNGEITEAKPA